MRWLKSADTSLHLNNLYALTYVGCDLSITKIVKNVVPMLEINDSFTYFCSRVILHVAHSSMNFSFWWGIWACRIFAISIAADVVVCRHDVVCASAFVAQVAL